MFSFAPLPPPPIFYFISDITLETKDLHRNYHSPYPVINVYVRFGT